VGPNPTDRAKGGTKRSLLTDGYGVPLGLAIDGANRHDLKLLAPTVVSIPVRRPKPTPRCPQGLCLDKGYDYDEARDLARAFGYTSHIRVRGEEAKKTRRHLRSKARRWVVERTHSWMNRFRRVLVRWEKRVQNYVGMLHLTCALITLRSAEVLG